MGYWAQYQECLDGVRMVGQSVVLFLLLILENATALGERRQVLRRRFYMAQLH